MNSVMDKKQLAGKLYRDEQKRDNKEIRINIKKQKEQIEKKKKKPRKL